MATLVLESIQLTQVTGASPIEKPTNDRYVRQTEENNKRIQSKINEYAEAYKNASRYFLK